MNNEICNAIDKLAEKFGIAVNWGNENVVPYIQDLIARYSKLQIVHLGIWGVILVILIIASIIGVIFSLTDKIENDNISAVVLGFSVIGMILCALIFPLVLYNFMGWIFVPDMQFMEEVLKIIK